MGVHDAFLRKVPAVGPRAKRRSKHVDERKARGGSPAAFVSAFYCDLRGRVVCVFLSFFDSDCCVGKGVSAAWELDADWLIFVMQSKGRRFRSGFCAKVSRVLCFLIGRVIDWNDVILDSGLISATISRQ